MFFFEKIVEYIKKDRFNEVLDDYERSVAQNPLSQIPLEDDLPPLEEDDSVNCEHIFMPIDSSGEILACSKCGLIKKKSELPPTNFFLNKNNVNFS